MEITVTLFDISALICLSNFNYLFTFPFKFPFYLFIFLCYSLFAFLLFIPTNKLIPVFPFMHVFHYGCHSNPITAQSVVKLKQKYVFLFNLINSFMPKFISISNFIFGAFNGISSYLLSQLYLFLHSWFWQVQSSVIQHGCHKEVGCILAYYSVLLPPAHTLYCQRYSLTHPNNWNQVFQSLPWPQVYKSKHLGMQTVSTNISERMGHSQSWNFLAPKYSTVNCQWYYNKVEAIGNNSNSATKW